MKIKDDYDLFVNSYFDAATGDRSVYLKWKSASGTLSAAQARTRAFALIEACAIAQTEARIFDLLIDADKPKGFGKQKVSDRDQMAVATLELLRRQRSPLPEDINPIYGHHTRLPIIEYRYDTAYGQLTIDAARHHAKSLLQVAEAVESDAFIHDLGSKINLNSQEISVLLSQFATFRQRSWLEELL